MSHHHHHRWSSPSGDGHQVKRGWGSFLGKVILFFGLIGLFLVMSARFILDHNYTGLFVFYAIWSVVYMLTVSKWLFPK